MKPYYVGYPRSGSHWIRLNLEGYTDGASPISNFLAAQNESIHKLYKRANRGEFSGTHDMDLKFKYPDVIYLYRNPIDTLYSYLKYEEFNESKLDESLSIWTKHIQKWYFDETFTKNKLIINYENLENDFVLEFSKILEFLKLKVDKQKIINNFNKFSKNKIRNIIHDKKVINVDKNYNSERDSFRESFGQQIVNTLPSSFDILWDVDRFPKEIQKFWKENCK